MGTQEVFKWVKNRAKEQSLFPDLVPKNFTTSFADGRLFLALLSIPAPELAKRIASNKNFEKESDILDALNETFEAFKKHFGVPILLDAEDLRIKPYPDKLSVATYCIEMRRRWDGIVKAPMPSSIDENKFTNKTPPQAKTSPCAKTSPLPPSAAVEEENSALKDSQLLNRELDELKRQRSQLADNVYEAERQIENLEHRRSLLQNEVDHLQHASTVPASPSKQLRPASSSSRAVGYALSTVAIGFATGFLLGAISILFLKQ